MKATKSQSCPWAQAGAQCSLWSDKPTSQPSWDLDTNPGSTEGCCLSLWSSSEDKKTSWQNPFFSGFATCLLKKVSPCCVPGLGLGGGSVTSLLEKHNSSPSIYFSFASPRCELFESRWFLRSPHTLLPPLVFTAEIVGKSSLGVPRVPGGKADVEGGLRGDCHCRVSQLCLWDPRYRGWGQTGLLGTVCRVHLEQASLTFRKGIFKNHKNNWTLQSIPMSK